MKKSNNMKKMKYIMAIGIVVASSAFAQDTNTTKWSLGLNYGVIGSVGETNSIDPAKSPTIRLNASVTLKPNFGIMFLGGYGSIGTKEGTSSKTQYGHASAEAVLSLGDFLFKEKSKFGISLHAGPGLLTMWNTDFVADNADDRYIKNQDDIVNLNFGIAPSLSIARNLNLNLDLSVAYNFMQNHSFDYLSRKTKTATMYTVSLGVVYQLTKKAKTTN
jgi:hypothetical protein